MTRVIGVGSPFGDDAVGWAVLDALAAMPMPQGVDLVRCGPPAAGLLGLLRGAEEAVLVDAVDTGDPAGTLCAWEGEEVLAARPALSSHGLDLAAVLALGEALGELPPRLRLYGVAIGSGCARSGAPGPLTAPVAAAVPALAAQIARTLRDGAATRGG
ncbi:MAG: hydrogenase maturation protease [Gammaproteobacteria bacterium]|nr:hydrogenase maturation protease [Gammaproteobacteria bacterium]